LAPSKPKPVGNSQKMGKLYHSSLVGFALRLQMQTTRYRGEYSTCMLWPKET